MLARGVHLVLALSLVSVGAAAEPEPCAADASFSPCFDADPLWLGAARSEFASMPSPRALAEGELSTVLGLGFSHRPVILVAPSPHRYGREVPVVENTSTLTLGAHYGIGHGLDFGIALPFVPYQTGTGVEGVTSQHGEALTATALRDPRLEFAATLSGRRPDQNLAIGTRLALVLPLGAASAFAGAAGPTVAPGLGASLTLGRFTLAADFTLRFRKAVNFASTRQGSEAGIAAGVAFDVLKSSSELGVGLEGWLRPKLASAPPGAAADTLDLPAEWLGSVHFSPERVGPWSFFAGAGSGLPLSRAAEPATPAETTLGVTAPKFRALLAVRRLFR
jgi:hypothetical protein